jgi:hypothetical protein
MKVYPWRGLKGIIRDKYGLFPKVGKLPDWPIMEVYDNPFELGEKFGNFVLKKQLSIKIEPERVLPKSGKQEDAIKYVKKGSVEPLEEWEFNSFVGGLSKGLGKGHYV